MSDLDAEWLAYKQTTSIIMAVAFGIALLIVVLLFQLFARRAYRCESDADVGLSIALLVGTVVFLALTCTSVDNAIRYTLSPQLALKEKADLEAKK